MKTFLMVSLLILLLIAFFGQIQRPNPLQGPLESREPFNKFKMAASHVPLAAEITTISKQDEITLNPMIHEIINHVSTENLFNTVAHLQAYGDRYSLEKQWLVAHWIEKRLKEYNVKAFIQTYEYEGKSYPNVIATIEGTEKSDQIILPIAHFDSISDDPKKKSAPGADDNASGVAVLLEIARILNDFPVKRTVILCFFSNEEVGRSGSKYAAQLFKSDGINIKAVLNLDVLGYNLPKSLFQFGALSTRSSLKNRMKSLYHAAKNSFAGLLKGRDAVVIGGRPDCGSLVERVSIIFRQYASLKVREIINDKCQ